MLECHLMLTSAFVQTHTGRKAGKITLDMLVPPCKHYGFDCD